MNTIYYYILYTQYILCIIFHNLIYYFEFISTLSLPFLLLSRFSPKLKNKVQWAGRPHRPIRSIDP